MQDLAEDGLGDLRWLDAEVARQRLPAASEGPHGLAAVARSHLGTHQPLIAELAVGLDRDRLLSVACCQQGISGLDPDRRAAVAPRRWPCQRLSPSSLIFVAFESIALLRDAASQP